MFIVDNFFSRVVEKHGLYIRVEKAPYYLPKVCCLHLSIKHSFSPVNLDIISKFTAVATAGIYLSSSLIFLFS